MAYGSLVIVKLNNSGTVYLSRRLVSQSLHNAPDTVHSALALTGKAPLTAHKIAVLFIKLVELLNKVLALRLIESYHFTYKH